MLSNPRTRDALAVLALLAATLACFSKLVLHPRDLLVGVQREGRNDLTGYFLAACDYPRQCRQDGGQLPLWNPYTLLGVPYVGNPQSAVYYPPNLLFRFVPATIAISWVIVAHHFVAGLGTFLFARSQGLGPTASTFAGVTFLAAPFLMAQTGEGHYAQLGAVTWIPWAFLAYGHLRKGGRYGMPLLALPLALSFFAGHAQETFYLGAILTTLAAADAMVDARSGREVEAWRWGFRFIGAGVTAVGLVTIDLLPILAYQAESVRSGALPFPQIREYSLSGASLRQLFDPFEFGRPDVYRGPGRFYWETVCHFGVVALVLATVAVIAQWRQPTVKRLAILAVLAVLFAFGPTLPVYPVFHYAFPGFSLFRVPSRMLFLASFAVAMLAGFGAERLVRAAATGLIFRLAAVLTLGIGVAELVRHADAILLTVPPNGIRSGEAVAGKVRDALENPDFRVLTEQSILNDREAWSFGVRTVLGYDPAPLARSFNYIDALYANRPRDAELEVLGFRPIRLNHLVPNLADLAGIGVAAVTRQDTAEGWTRVGEGNVRAPVRSRNATLTLERPYAIFRNADPMPRAFTVGKVRTVRSLKEGFDALPTLDPRAEVVLEVEPFSRSLDTTSTPARVTASGRNRLSVEVETAGDAYLVVTDAYSAGWTAIDNGRAVPVWPADMAFRAVPLAGKGVHRVEFRYVPPRWSLGASITGLTLAVVIAGIVGQTWRDRRLKESVPSATG